MSRFKFACNCGKRMAAYDWMVGQVITCPKCGRTMTVPTPFQGEEHIAEMIEKGYSLQKKQLGVPVTSSHNWRKIILTTLYIAFGLAAAVGLIYWIIF